MQTLRDITNALTQSQSGVTSQILKDLIEMNKDKQKAFNDKYLRYRQESVPILSKQKQNPSKVDVRIANDFVGDVVDVKVGYFGQGISVKLDKTKYDSDAAFEVDDELIQSFETANNTDDLNAETVKHAAITGLAARLLYIDTDGTPRVMPVDSWETIFIYDRSLSEVQYAMRYYVMTFVDKNREEHRYRGEWYDSQNVTFYIQDKDGTFVLDSSESINPLPHQFDGIPLIAFPNNEELMGDCDKVLSHIDAYDTTISDVISEIQQFRVSYLKMKGSLANDDTVKQLAQSGIIALDENGDIDWLIKDLPLEGIMSFQNKIADLIMRFGKSVDFGDASFASGLPVLAYKLKLFALETKCQTMEHKFRKSLFQQYSLLCDWWRANNKGDIDPSLIEFVFVRNFPNNVDAEIQNLAAMATPVSNKTMYGITSFIPDAEKEMEQIRLEAEDEESFVSEKSVTEEETPEEQPVEQPIEEGVNNEVS